VRVSPADRDLQQIVELWQQDASGHVDDPRHLRHDLPHRDLESKGSHSAGALESQVWRSSSAERSAVTMTARSWLAWVMTSFSISPASGR
jgi:hypothetical protein